MGKTLTGFHLKVIGVISMVFDHLLQFFSFLGVPGWFGWIGRIAHLFSYLKVLKASFTQAIGENTCSGYC